MKIIIIKLGALGDVLRTTSILPAIRKKYPLSEIFWITKPESIDLLSSNPYIQKIFTPKLIPKTEFDILYNFDIDEEATELAEKLMATKKYGFRQAGGYPSSFNSGAEYYLNTLFDDELKKSNKKTYQEMMFETAELEYKKEHCPLNIDKKELEFAKKFVEENHINTNRLIGIHLGSSSRWPSKRWHFSALKEFILKARQRNFEILLFGGPNEVNAHKSFKNELEKEGIKIFANNPKNTLKEFISLVNLCKKMVCSDSLALHVSLALKKPTIGLFFCTSPDEVEGYSFLKKIVSPMLKEFFPEKSNEYSEELSKSINAEEVLKALEN